MKAALNEFKPDSPYGFTEGYLREHLTTAEMDSFPRWMRGQTVAFIDSPSPTKGESWH